MKKELLQSLAILMYDNYCVAVGGKAFNGDLLPKGKDFFADENKKKQSDAWLSAATSAITFVNLNPLIITEGVLGNINVEIQRAENKHPLWPSDKVYAATIVAEESGELTRACLQFENEGGDIEEIRKEAIQTAATCIRLLKNL